MRAWVIGRARAARGALVAAALGATAAATALAGCAASFDEAPRQSSIHELTARDYAGGSRIRELHERPLPAALVAGSDDGDGACGRLSWPVEGPLASPFGRRDGRMHDGVDLGVPEGTPVRAACGGVVAYAGDRLRGYGRLLIVRHGAGLSTVYAHNQELLVSEGEPVRRGQVIARSGQTGRVTAPHLHFEVRKDSIARDPLGYLRARPRGPMARRAPIR